MNDLIAPPHPELQAIAERIYARSVKCIIENGRDLIQAKERMVHGQWLPWLRSIDWNDRAASRCMSVARWINSLPKSKSDKLSNLPPSGLYLLSAPSTPESAVDRVLASAQRFQIAHIKKIIEDEREELEKPEDPEVLEPSEVLEEVEPKSKQQPDSDLEIPEAFKRKVSKSPEVEEPPSPKSRKPTKRQLEIADRDARIAAAHVEICAILQKLPEADLKRLVYIINEDWGLVGLEDSEAWRWIQLEFDPHDNESATVAPPTEHKGLKVEQLGFVPAESMSLQVGLDDRILLLRRITIEPGGQIGKHSAETTPAVVYMESGIWTEGRESGETEHSAGETFIEDQNTVHWFYNRGAEPAAALVCDIKPAS